MTPIIWSIFFIGVLISAIIIAGILIFFYKDKSDQQNYIDYLKGQNLKLKNRSGNTVIPCRDAGIELLKETINYVRNEYHSKFDSDIIKDEQESTEYNSNDKERTILIAGYQALVYELNGLENSQKPSEVWQRIQKGLSILTAESAESAKAIHTPNSDQPVETTEELLEQLKIAHQRISNLEKFKKLYFELQNKISANINLGEQINAEVIEVVHELPDNENLIKLLEKHNNHYVDMGKLADMNKENHHFSVHYLNSFSEHYLNERKTEIKRLKSQIASQFEEIWRLQQDLSNNTPKIVHEESITDKHLMQQLKDAELCIETMDMEIQTLTSELTNSQKLLEESTSQSGNELPIKEKNDIYSKFAQESNDMMACIANLEETNEKQIKTIKKLEEKNTRLQKEYTDIENKYLELVKNENNIK